MEVAKVCLGFSVFLDHCSPSVAIHGVAIWGLSRILGISKLMYVCWCYEVDVLALCLSCSYCSSWHNTLFTNFHTVVPGAVWFPEIWHENGSLFAFSNCSGAVNKEIDDKVVEKRQLGRTTPHEWQRAWSAFTAKNAAPSREPTVLEHGAKTWSFYCTVRLLCFSCIFPAFSFLSLRFMRWSEKICIVTLPLNNCHFLWIRINSPWLDLVNIRLYSENIKAVVFIFS